ncbi:MAG: hypothetical protein NTY09_01585 [bacterium]|nr:hypothetical protein [bacterium]
MKKKFDAVAMKRKAQEEIYEEIKNLTADEKVEYFNKAGERFRQEMESMRAKKENSKDTKAKKKETAAK